MATRTWINNQTGVYDVATNYVKGVAPSPGDTAVLTSGSVDFTGLDVVDQTINIHGPNITMDNTTFSATTTLDASFGEPQVFVSGVDNIYGEFKTDFIDIYTGDGTLANYGSFQVGADFHLTLNLPGATFDNEASGKVILGVGSRGGEILESSNTSFINDGLVSLVSPNATGLDVATWEVSSQEKGSGTYLVDGGHLKFDDVIDGQQIFDLKSGTIVMAAGGAFSAFQFMSDTGTLVLGDETTYQVSGEIVGFQEGDIIDLGSSGFDAANYDQASHTLSLSSGGTVVTTLDMLGSYAQGGSDFSLVKSGSGDDYLETSKVACFCSGTLITTPNGDRPIENLRKVIL